MEIKRTSNAGVLIKTDNISLLLDGVSGEVFPYMETPFEIKKELMYNLPDLAAFTHFHKDHFDEDFAEYYKNNAKNIVSPENPVSLNVGSVKLECIKTRHIGKSDVPHISFCITGSKCVWFTGDASPASLKEFEKFPKPNVLVTPFAFANTPSSWRMAKEVGAEKIIILHLPDKANDSFGLNDAVLKITENDNTVTIPNIGETIVL